MKILTIVGARPQFIKAAPVSRALRERGHTEFLLHTGQHYDQKMSGVFFEELSIPTPDANLEVGSGSHSRMTGTMLIKVEEVLVEQKPDCVLVYGDTNSTLAGAVAACQLQIRLAHVEAGLRSYNRTMPEEHNRVLTDHLADLLLCPTRTAVANLRTENLFDGVHLVGDTMLDAIRMYETIAEQRSQILQAMGLAPRGYVLSTLHRPYNTDDPAKLATIIDALGSVGETVVFPIHPRTRKTLEHAGIEVPASVRVVDPVGYLDMVRLMKNARIIITDSGGIQKEAYFLRVPCITVRPETEWVETLEAGWNILVECDELAKAIRDRRTPAGEPPPVFGHGDAAQRIVTLLEGACGRPRRTTRPTPAAPHLVAQRR